MLKSSLKNIDICFYLILHKVLARIPTATGTRTSLFIPEQKRLYLAVPHRGDQQAEIRAYAIEP